MTRSALHVAPRPTDTLFSDTETATFSDADALATYVGQRVHVHAHAMGRTLPDQLVAAITTNILKATTTASPDGKLTTTLKAIDTLVAAFLAGNRLAVTPHQPGTNTAPQPRLLTRR